MQSTEIRDRFLKFFKARGHNIIPSAPVVPENDPSSLFTTAGMQPLVPYLLGEDHPGGNRLANVQKCVRTNDIDEIGDATHGTFFEMLGNWSLGDYWKREAIEYTYTFLISKEEGLGLDPNRLYITVFEGNENAQKDTESIEIWKSLGVPENRIYELGADSNWWSPGDNGPCGPDTEIFYDLTEEGLGDLSKEEYLAADEKQDVVEIGNNVFMEYLKEDGKIVGKLEQRNVDFGGGFERLVMATQMKRTVYKTDIFESQLQYLSNFDTTADDTKSRYIICDHLRAAMFIISDGVIPSNTDQGYILRRLIRRAIVQGRKLGLKRDNYLELFKLYVKQYQDYYRNIDIQPLNKIFVDEFDQFSETLEKGLREFDKVSKGNITGKDAFKLFSTYGFPLELTQELAAEKDLTVDIAGFEVEYTKHQQASRAGSDQKFKGGLADNDEMSVKYHTATHLLHAALRDILGPHVQQKGSNITPDRLRFDFSHPEKLTNSEKIAIEDWVNDKINQGLVVSMSTMFKDDAIKSGAIGLFAEKYGENVTVYTIGKNDNWVSRELCGGPHVANTAELGIFKIKKEQASSAGVRRIKAILE
jgi:alanyl-tRNA synthetase